MSTIELYKKYTNEIQKLNSKSINCYGKRFFADIEDKIKFQRLSIKLFECEAKLNEEGFIII